MFNRHARFLVPSRDEVNPARSIIETYTMLLEFRNFIKNENKVETIRIDILNPKAKKLLKGLADLNLIKISKEENKSDFSTLLKKLRAKSKDEISLDDITKEVEQVRKSRHEK